MRNFGVLFVNFFFNSLLLHNYINTKASILEGCRVIKNAWMKINPPGQYPFQIIHICDPEIFFHDFSRIFWCSDKKQIINTNCNVRIPNADPTCPRKQPHFMLRKTTSRKRTPLIKRNFYFTCLRYACPGKLCQDWTFSLNLHQNDICQYFETGKQTKIRREKWMSDS